MRSRCAVVVAFALAVIASLAGSAAAAPFTAAFDPLIADLESRRAGGYEPPLTAAQKKELKAIEASLARLGREHADVAADVKSAAAVVKSLRSGFPAEFGPGAVSSLPGLVAGTISALAAAVESEYGRLDDAVARIADSRARAAASAKLSAARTALDAAAVPETTPSRAASLLSKALKAARKGLSIAAPHVDGFFTAKVDGRTLVAAEFSVEAHSAADTIVLRGSFVLPASGETATITIVVPSPAVGSQEIGAFSPLGGAPYGLYHLGDIAEERIWYSQFGGGVIDLDAYDRASGRAAGTFRFDSMRDGNSTVKIRSGRFAVTSFVER